MNPSGASATRRIDFDLRDDAAGSDAPDRAIAQAASAAGLPFLTVTDELRKKSEGKAVWFALDGRMNAFGNCLLGEAVAPSAARLLAAPAARARFRARGNSGGIMLRVVRPA